MKKRTWSVVGIGCLLAAAATLWLASHRSNWPSILWVRRPTLPLVHNVPDVRFAPDGKRISAACSATWSMSRDDRLQLVIVQPPPGSSALPMADVIRGSSMYLYEVDAAQEGTGSAWLRMVRGSVDDAPPLPGEPRRGR